MSYDENRISDQIDGGLIQQEEQQKNHTEMKYITVEKEGFKELIKRAYDEGVKDCANHDPERHGMELPSGEGYLKERFNFLMRKDTENKNQGQGQKYLTQMEAMEIVQKKWAENEGLKEACKLIKECAEKGGQELWMELTDNVFLYLTKYLGYPYLETRGRNEYLITW